MNDTDYNVFLLYAYSDDKVIYAVDSSLEKAQAMKASRPHLDLWIEPMKLDEWDRG